MSPGTLLTAEAAGTAPWQPGEQRCVDAEVSASKTWRRCRKHSPVSEAVAREARDVWRAIGRRKTMRLHRAWGPALLLFCAHRCGCLTTPRRRRLLDRMPFVILYVRERRMRLNVFVCRWAQGAHCRAAARRQQKCEPAGNRARPLSRPQGP